MTVGRINYRKKAREELKKCTAVSDAIDRFVWDSLQKAKAEADYKRNVKRYLGRK